MAGMLLGMETEYAFSAWKETGERIDREQALDRFLALARRRLRHLRDPAAPGLYLTNGSRLYVDAGSHPELSTPECDSPWEVVRFALAGERILCAIAAELEKSGHQRVSIFRCNVDYKSRQTWGCHESYLHRARPDCEEVGKRSPPAGHYSERVLDVVD